jgi:uncharacterized protein
LLLALSTLLLAFAARAQTYTVPTVPNPRTADGGFVTDAAQVLGAAEPVIEARLRDFKARTGAEVAVVILPSIGDAVPKYFANALFQLWGVGQRGADNGALVLHVLDQRRIEIETGYGSEGPLPDVKCHWLIESVVIPAFKAGHFAEGHDALTRGIVYALEHPEAGRDELLNSAATSGTFANVPAPQAAFARPSEPELAPAAGLARFLPTPLHALPLLLLLVFTGLRNQAHRRLYSNPTKRPLAKTAVAGIVAPLLWGGAAAGAAIGQLSWLHHVAASLLLGTAGIIAWDWRRTQRLGLARHAPRNCARCGAAMVRADDGEAEQLEDWRALEERMGAWDYDVWTCACGERTLFRYDGVTPRAQCSQCRHHTTTRERVVLRPATQLYEGEARITTHCEFCGHEIVVHEVLPRLPPPSSSSSSSGGSSSSSFGGGSSGGGGAGGSY